MTQNSQKHAWLEELGKHYTGENLVMVSQGSYNKEHITAIILDIESKAKEAGYNMSFITKLKLVSVEILQNISKHRVIHNEALCYFVCGFGAGEVALYSGNIVSKKAMNVIDDRLKIYIGLQANILKDFYRDSLKHTAISEAGNAGIGLLDIVYRSNQQVEYAFELFRDDLYYFELKVKLPAQARKKD